MDNEVMTAPARRSLAGQFVTTMKVLAIMAAVGLGLWLLDNWLVG